MGYRGYGAIFRRSWIVIVVLTILGALAGWGASLLVTPSYASRSVVFVSTQTGATANELTLGSTFALNRVETYASLASQPAVLDPVISQLGLDASPGELATAIVAEPQPQTSMIDIDVQWPDADQSALIANAVASSLATIVEELEVVTEGTPSPVRVEQVRLATPAPTPASPDVLVFALIGALIGLIVGIGIGAVRVITDTRLRSADDVEAATDVPIVGTVPQARRNETSLLIRDAPYGVRAEAYRVARTNLQFLRIRDRRSFVVTSAQPAEGKTTTAANLALSLAAADMRVALVDGDLRSPRVGTIFGIEDVVGLSDVLIGRASIDDVAQPIGDTGLVVISAGAIPPNPSELLASERMSALAEELERGFDLVIFDSPPLLAVTDAAVLARFAVPLMVVSAKKSHAPELTRALAALRKVGSPAGGIIVGQVAAGDTDYGPYGAYGNTPQPATRPARSAEPARTDSDPAELGDDVDLAADFEDSFVGTSDSRRGARR